MQIPTLRRFADLSSFEIHESRDVLTLISLHSSPDLSSRKITAGTGNTIVGFKRSTVCVADPPCIIDASIKNASRTVYYRSKDEKLPDVSAQPGPEQSGEVFFDVRL